MNIVRTVIAALIGLLLFLPLFSDSSVEAAVSQNVTVIATPDVGGGIANFTIIWISDTELNFTWNYTGDAVNAMIRAKYNAAPDGIPDENTEPSDGYLVYYGAGVAAEDTSMNLDLNTGAIHYTIWGQKADTKWYVFSLTDNMEGIALTLIALILIPLGLTVALFGTKNALLGFPSAIFWAVLGAYAYTLSSIPWGDWQYFLFFGAFGMVIFTTITSLGLRNKEGVIADEEVIEKSDIEKDIYIDEVRPRRKLAQQQSSVNRRMRRATSSNWDIEGD